MGAGAMCYRFNGKEFSEELGLYDYGARWYDPAVARWTTVDPLASSMASWSPYNYVYNNPLKFTDPTGMAPFTDYYNQNGKHVKNVDDGSDAKVMVMTTSKKAEDVDAAIANGETGPVASNAALEQMDAAYEATANNGNERGFAVATDGTTSTMAEGTTGEVDILPKRADLVGDGKTVAYDVHTHPEGDSADEVGSPMPSGADQSGAATTDPQHSVVFYSNGNDDD
jgi:RHS repeat-associated protein